MELTERRKTLLPDWRRLVFWLGLAVAFALYTGPLLDPDLPWHLSAARNMAATGGVPRGDFLSWTMAGKPWVDFEWGTQLIFYGLYKVGGTTALCLFKAVAYFCVTLFFAALLELWTLPVLWTGLAAPLFALALLPIAQIRPEIFSLLLFSLELYLMERRRLGRLVMSDRSLLALHLPLYILWANLHAGFVTGLLLCACYGAGEFIAAGRRKAAYLFALAAVGAAGTLVNPYGVKIYGVLADHWRHLDYLHYLISEWDMPGFSKYHLDGYWCVVAVSFVGCCQRSGAAARASCGDTGFRSAFLARRAHRALCRAAHLSACAVRVEPDIPAQMVAVRASATACRFCRSCVVQRRADSTRI